MRNRKLLACAIVLLMIVGLALLLTAGRTSTTPEPDSKVPQSVLATIIKYEQAKENSNGSDQTSPTQWLQTIKPVVTPKFWASLQPDPSSPTSSVPYDYTYAHQNNLEIKVQVSNCYWAGIYAIPTSDKGQVLCSLRESTINSRTNAEVPVGSLQLGWSHTGKQTPPNLGLAKLNGTWLVNSDNTGQGY